MLLFPLILDFIGRSNIPVFLFNTIHSWLGLIIGFVMILHLLLHLDMISKMKNKISKKQIKKGNKRTKFILNFSVDIILSIFFIIIFISGIILFPGFLQIIGINPVNFPTYAFVIIHEWLGIIAVGLIIVHIYLNLNWLKARTKTIIKLFKQKPEIAKKTIITIGVVIILILISSIFFTTGPIAEVLGFPIESRISISGVGTFDYDSNEIKTVREDIFREGHISIFDILVHLDDSNQIDMKYHFDEEINTYIIDSINGKNNFWYEAYYDGGVV